MQFLAEHAKILGIVSVAQTSPGVPATGIYHLGRALVLYSVLRWEPLYEATQIKGDGESHKVLSPNDEFASYEPWDKGNLNLSVPKKPEMPAVRLCRSGL